jgi:heat shock protein HtpX
MRRNGSLAAALVSGGLAAAVLTAGWALAGTAGLAGACSLLIAAWWLAYFFAERVVLIALGARPVTEVERPALFRLVRELSTEARVPVPRLFVSPSPQPNSLVVGCTVRTAALCVTEGLLAVLSPEELRAVIGHELAHIRRGDMVLSTMPALVASVLLWPGPALAPLAALVVRTVVLSREFEADTDGALLVGSPLSLASALRKIELGARSAPAPFDGRLAATAHLLIVDPFAAEGLARLFDTHPPAGERLRRLESLAGYPR